MSFRDQIAIDVSSVFLDTEGGFAAEHTQYPEGVVSDAATVSGIFTEEVATRRNEHGDNTLRRATLLISAAEVVGVSDLWLIDSEVWGVKTCEKVVEGLREIELVRVEKRTTRTAQPVLR